MAHAQREKMKTTRIVVDGIPVIIGALRKHGTTPLIEAPFVVKAFNEEHGTNVKLIGPRTADHLLVKTNNLKEVTDAFPSPVDAAIAYEKPGKKLGAEIVFALEGEPRVVLATGIYKGEKNIALVTRGITAEDIQRDGTDILIMVPEERLIVVPDFPPENGWYMPHAETIVPNGKKVEASHEARYLWRKDNESYVDLIARGVVSWLDPAGRRGVSADCRTIFRQFGNFGVAVEVPENDALLITEPLGASTELAITHLVGIPTSMMLYFTRKLYESAGAELDLAKNELKVNPEKDEEFQRLEKEVITILSKKNQSLFQTVVALAALAEDRGIEIDEEVLAQLQNLPKLENIIDLVWESRFKRK